jgi:hypothetical protein
MSEVASAKASFWPQAKAITSSSQFSRSLVPAIPVGERSACSGGRHSDSAPKAGTYRSLPIGANPAAQESLELAEAPEIVRR